MALSDRVRAAAPAPVPHPAEAAPAPPPEPAPAAAVTIETEPIEDLASWLQEGTPDGALGEHSLGNLVDQLDDILAPSGEVSPGAAAEQSPPTGGDVPPPDDLAEMREMFDGIAAVYVKPVRQFLARLATGPVSAEWIEICLPAVGMVSRSARSMGLERLAPRLEAFEALLRKAGEADAKAVDGEARDAILAACADLREALPQAFATEDRGDQRDSIILHSLLRQVPEVGRVTLDKIFGAGLTSIEMLERANVGDLSVTTGISTRLSERICDFMRQYRADKEARRASDSPKGWLAALRPLVDALREHHKAFERYTGGDEDRPEEAANRKLHRRARQDVGLKLNILLAEMGEVQMVDELQRLPFEARLQALQTFLGTLAEAAAGPTPNSGP